MSKTSPKQTDQKLWEFASKPTFWITKAERLRASADLLYEDMKSRGLLVQNGWDNEDHAAVFLMLMGYGIEDLAKGILIFDNPVLRHGWKLNSFLTTHDLRTLVRASTNDDEVWLDKLRDYVEYAGRYPAPKSSNQETHMFLLPTGMFDQSRALYDKLKTMIESKTNGWLD